MGVVMRSCSISGTMRERGEDGAHQRRRRHQDIPVGSSRSASPHIRSAKVTAPRPVGRECPWPTESPAARLLGEQDMTRQDAINFIIHGTVKGSRRPDARAEAAPAAAPAAGEAGAAPATARAPAKPPAGGVVLRKLTDEEREGRQSALDEAKRKAQQEAKKRFGGEEESKAKPVKTDRPQFSGRRKKV
jgi:hypothetical protein